MNSDKTLYEPGEQVWLSMVLLDRQTNLLTRKDQNIVLTLEDQYGSSIMESNVQLNSGTGKASFKIPELNKFGDYYLSASMSSFPEVWFEKKLKIAKNAIPSFLINVINEKKYYAAGEKMIAHLEVTDYFNTPLKGANYVINLISGLNTLSYVEGKLDKNGKGAFEFKLPEVLKDEPVFLSINISDNQYTESYSLPISVESDNIHVQFFPESGQLVHGLRNIMKIQAKDRYGNSFPFTAQIINKENDILATISGDEKGLAAIPVLPNYSKELKMVITKPFFVDKAFAFPDVKPSGIHFTIQEAGFDSLLFTIKSTSSLIEKSATLLNIHDGESEFINQFTLKDKLEVKMPKSMLKPGINQLTIFDSDTNPMAENMYFLNPKMNTEISIQPINESYQNREKIEFSIVAPDETMVSLNVVDEYRLSHDNNSQNLWSFVYLNSELRKSQFLDTYEQSLGEGWTEQVNTTLQYSLPFNNWNHIYQQNNKSINFNYEHQAESFFTVPNQLYHLKNEGGHSIYTNYPYDIYYLASNPILFKNLKKVERKDRKPPYKTLLESGTPVRDVINVMKPYKLMDGKIVFAGAQNSLIAQGGALIVIDGVRTGEFASVLDQINPFDVDEIKISTQAIDILDYTGLNSVGVIDIKLKRGGKDKIDEETNTEFEYVDHEKDRKKWRNEDDLRTTIHWKTFHYLESEEETVEFYHSDIRGNFVGTIEGIDQNGKPFVRKVAYKSYQYSEENP